MDVTALLNQSTNNNTSPNAEVNQARSFREADFLRIMLMEVTNQDPMKPMETSELVEGMRRLQDLATSQFEKFRNDLRWAQDLVGKPVVVGQANVSATEADRLAAFGVAVDVGYGVVSGEVETYRVVDEQVWISVNGKDYPVDNIQKIEPAGFDAGYAVNLADGLVGREVTWLEDGDFSKRKTGLVTNVEWDSNGEVTLTAAGQSISFEDVIAIGDP